MRFEPLALLALPLPALKSTLGITCGAGIRCSCFSGANKLATGTRSPCSAGSPKRKADSTAMLPAETPLFWVPPTNNPSPGAYDTVFGFGRKLCDMYMRSLVSAIVAKFILSHRKPTFAILYYKGRSPL